VAFHEFAFSWLTRASARHYRGEFCILTVDRRTRRISFWTLLDDDDDHDDDDDDDVAVL
jgi:hypothetical protein